MEKKRQNNKLIKEPVATLQVDESLLPNDYSLMKDGAIYSEVVIKAHIRISNDQVRRTSYAIEIHADPSLSEQIPDSWGMMKFAEVEPEVGKDTGPDETFLT